MKIFSINSYSNQSTFTGRSRKINPDLVKQFSDAGLSINEISIKLNASVGRVATVLNNIRQKESLLGLESYKEKIRELVDLNYSVDEIARALNLKSIDTEELVRRSGKRILHPEKFNCKNAYEEEGKFRRLLREGDSRIQIAELYGVSSNRVSGWLRECELDIPMDKMSPSKEQISKVLSEEHKLGLPAGSIHNFGVKLGISNALFDHLVEKYGLQEEYWRVIYNL